VAETVSLAKLVCGALSAPIVADRCRAGGGRTLLARLSGGRAKLEAEELQKWKKCRGAGRQRFLHLASE